MHSLLINLCQRKFSRIEILQFLLFFCMFEYMLVPRLNNNDVSSLHEKSRTTDVPATIKEEPAPVPPEKVNEDMFTYRIKETELLYNPIILEAASQNHVDLTLVKAIIMAESGYNIMTLSKEGAAGLMQLMPGTARSLGVKDIYNPEENIYAGVRYLKKLLNRFNGDKKMALAAYNAGISRVIKYKGVPPFKETHQYIKKVLAYQRFYKHGDIPEETNL